jgi:hypothetical protein
LAVYGLYYFNVLLLGNEPTKITNIFAYNISLSGIRYTHFQRVRKQLILSK